MRRGRLIPSGPLTLGDLRRAVANANLLGYADSASVEVKTPLPPRDRRAVEVIITDGAADALGEPSGDAERGDVVNE